MYNLDKSGLSIVEKPVQIFPHEEQHEYTFYDKRNDKPISDYIINRMLLSQQLIHVRVLTAVNIGTDYKLCWGKYEW